MFDDIVTEKIHNNVTKWYSYQFDFQIENKKSYMV